jgi:hypothetical protein
MLQLDRTAARQFYVCSDSERINNIDVFTAPTLPSMAISQVNANGWSKRLTPSD